MPTFKNFTCDVDNKIRNELFIFCQAPADVPYVLSIYEKNYLKCTITIYIINVENIFNFLKGLNLKLKNLIFIPYTHGSFKNPANIFKERRRINSLKKIYFNGVHSSQVYFFSRFEDWLTASFIKSLSKTNTIYYCDYYDFSSELFKKRGLNIKSILLKAFLYFLTGTIFKFEIIEKLPEFDYSKYLINKIEPNINRIVFEKYAYSFHNKFESIPSVLFFIAPCDSTIYNCISYKKMLIDIVLFFKISNWNVIVKGHPRKGVPNEILSNVHFEIPSYIPAEFINIQGFTICLGIDTAAIAFFAKNTSLPSFSLINLFEFNNLDRAESYKQYLSELSDYKLKFFQDYSDFQCTITSKVFSNYGSC